MYEAKPRFLQKKTKEYTLAVLYQEQNVIRIKLGPGTYQLFLLPGIYVACMYAHTPMHTAEIWKNNII